MPHNNQQLYFQRRFLAEDGDPSLDTAVTARAWADQGFLSVSLSMNDGFDKISLHLGATSEEELDRSLKIVDNLHEVVMGLANALHKAEKTLRKEMQQDKENV